MVSEKGYNRKKAVEYARKWALGRNPEYESFNGIGGDCTNFISQCLYAGGLKMNFTPIFGWYYRNSSERTASWTGVQFFYNFMISDKGYASESDSSALDIGDVIQLGRKDGTFYHTLIVTGFNKSSYLVCAHSDDSLDRPLDTYSYYRVRFLKINDKNI